ncbi:hypothetical protein FOMPIDRAFT_1030616 [Fomitopsis schrenkii]|uniref:Myosin motor domain-containing protein n=1 Tax=Fomitopsis schrenkii TaxID=2126942 RepID=S8E685_FOMSC|nr:hypothetical protein FOMPIDRAFT_1030616 [Fomitopsis schrenkii]
MACHRERFKLAWADEEAISLGELTDLISSSSSATVYPSDIILSIPKHPSVQTSQCPHRRVNLVNVNPYKTLSNVSDESVKQYEERCYKDTSLPLPGGPPHPQPHIFDLAAKVYLLMRRRNASLAMILRSQLLVNQVLRLSSRSKKKVKLSNKIKALLPLLDLFGNAKTLLSLNASRCGRYLELHFNKRGRINGAKVLTYGLDKSSY